MEIPHFSKIKSEIPRVAHWPMHGISSMKLNLFDTFCFANTTNYDDIHVLFFKCIVKAMFSELLITFQQFLVKCFHYSRIMFPMMNQPETECLDWKMKEIKIEIKNMIMNKMLHITLVTTTTKKHLKSMHAVLARLNESFEKCIAIFSFAYVLFIQFCL